MKILSLIFNLIFSLICELYVCFVINWKKETNFYVAKRTEIDEGNRDKEITTYYNVKFLPFASADDIFHFLSSISLWLISCFCPLLILHSFSISFCTNAKWAYTLYFPIIRRFDFNYIIIILVHVNHICI